MSFSALNVGTSMVNLTGNKRPSFRLASKPVAGGSFTPNTLEAAFVLRQSLDYQYESAFVTKYKQLMQNRLNALSTQLKEAYTNLLNTSMGQQIGEEASVDVRSDVILDGTEATRFQDVGGLNARAGAFEDLGQDPSANLADWNQNAQSDATLGAGGLLADRLSNSNVLPEDNVFGYTRQLDTNHAVDFKALHEFTTAAGNMSSNLNVTMRAEEDPPKKETTGGLLGILGRITSVAMGGPPEPTYFNQKLEQSETQAKTGGFWSSVNYLYNFAPSELKYSYAVGYTANSDEAGNDHVLLEGKMLDLRDNVYGVENPPGGSHIGNDPNIFTPGHRVQWNSIEPTQGYSLEKSGTAANYTTVVNRKNAFLDHSGSATAGGEFIWNDIGNTAKVESQGVINNFIPFESGTRTHDQTNLGDIWNGVVDVNSNIEPGSVFKHKVDWNGANDDTRDGLDKTTSRGAINSSLFLNHYEVETRTVEFNNAARDGFEGQVYIKGGLHRSHSVDASKNYDLLVQDINGDGDTLDTNVPTQFGDLEDERQITRSAGNTANSFNGNFVQGIHKIHSFNSQDIANNNEHQANPIMGNFELGRYQAIENSYQMSRNIIPYVAPTESDVNGSLGAPTDWHQAELLVSAVDGSNIPALSTGKVWFPYLEDSIFTGNNGEGFGAFKVNSSPPVAQESAVIQARNTFKLAQSDFLAVNDAVDWIPGNDGIIRPTYTRKNFVVDLDLTGIRHQAGAIGTNTKIFINGQEVTPTVNTETLLGGDTYDVNVTLDLAPFLQEDLNTLVVQTVDGTYDAGTYAFSEGISLVPNTAANLTTITSAAGGTTFTGGFPEVNDIINHSLITGYDSINAVKNQPDMIRAGTAKIQSRWQTRLVPPTTLTDGNNKLLTMASARETTGSSFKVSNVFIEMIMEALNQDKYRDVFKLGLLSNLNKLAISGQSSLPNGASMEGQLSLFFDPESKSMVVNQDKLVAKS